MYTVVPAMNGHPRDQAKVSVHDRWPLIRGTGGQVKDATYTCDTKLFSCDTSYSRLEHTTCDINYSSIEHLRYDQAQRTTGTHTLVFYLAFNFLTYILV